MKAGQAQRSRKRSCPKCGHLMRARNRYGGHDSACPDAEPEEKYLQRKATKERRQ